MLDKGSSIVTMSSWVAVLVRDDRLVSEEQVTYVWDPQWEGRPVALVDGPVIPREEDVRLLHYWKKRWTTRGDCNRGMYSHGLAFSYGTASTC